MIFGKRISEYLRFQRVWLAVLAAVGLARLGLSLAGLPDRTVMWLSMTVVGWAAIFYYGVAVHTRGFGSYRHLVPLILFQMVLVQSIAVFGILLAIAGVPNIYAAPEFSGPPFARSTNQWTHALAHLTIGIVVPTLLGWGVASLVLLITKAVTRRSVVV
ncbi:MAG: hypothetical protein DMF78_14020 [Acidobacteria bacterium]|nr:MAG: hypothetical protein DMF78_14020 [Acidobacteriota bacterium]